MFLAAELCQKANEEVNISSAYSVDEGGEKEPAFIVSIYWSVGSNYCGRYFYTDFYCPVLCPL